MQHGWSQAELAQRAGIPRSSVSAIESQRLTPSVTAALALARALERSVEELFADNESMPPHSSGQEWAWQPRLEPSRYWEAEVAGRRWLYPVEALAFNATVHDGLWQEGVERNAGTNQGTKTLAAACCDPAAGLLAAEYARTSGLRLIVFPRGSEAALELLRRGLVHVAGVHRATTERPNLNTETVRERLGAGYRLLRAAQWEEGIAVSSENRTRSASSALRQSRRWALREPGSAARECLDELSGRDRVSGRVVDSHMAVAQAVRAGWAEAGVCVRLAADEAGLNFLPIRTEALDLCFPDALTRDARVQALIRLLRSRAHKRLISDLPGYDARDAGAFCHS